MFDLRRKKVIFKTIFPINIFIVFSFVILLLFSNSLVNKLLSNTYTDTFSIILSQTNNFDNYIKDDAASVNKTIDYAKSIDNSQVNLSSLYLDNSGKVVYSKDSNKIGKTLDDINAYSLLKTEVLNSPKTSGGGTIKLDEIYAYGYTKISTGYYIALIPLSSVTHSVLSAGLKVVLLLFIILIFNILISYFTSKRFITKPIMKIVGDMDKASNGDLTVHINLKGEDEIAVLGNRFNHMISEQKVMQQNIKDMIQSLKNITSTISDTSAANKLSMDELSKKTNSIASAIENTSSAIESNRSTVHLIYEAAENTASTSVKTAENANDVNDEIKQAMTRVDNSFTSMKELKDTSLEAKNAIERLSDHSQKIMEIISTITDISEQTNLLALNASIEAARAGEAGKGFAVVAEEIRKLAENSRTSAEDIQELIKNVVHDTDAAVDKMDVTFTSVDTSVNNFNEIQAIFNNMKERIQNISSMIETIAASTEEQSSSVQELSSGTDIIASSSGSIEKAIVNISSEIEKQNIQLSNLTEQSTSLNELMNKLKLASEKYKI
ncbi:MAG: HAMP domain-containing methyl-accepting chemotaxis protein [Bacillota bacterium]|nr:HAMP domain-containing methyl-accepting chemotaxis protein [Bacillota bacterium]